MLSLQNRLNKYILDTTESTAISAVQASYNVQAAAIITLTTSGDTAIKCAKYRPQCPVVAVSRVDQVARQLQLHRGVIPLLYQKDRQADWTQDVDTRVQFAIDFGKKSVMVGFFSGSSIIDRPYGTYITPHCYFRIFYYIRILSTF